MIVEFRTLRDMPQIRCLYLVATGDVDEFREAPEPNKPYFALYCAIIQNVHLLLSCFVFDHRNSEQTCPPASHPGVLDVTVKLVLQQCTLVRKGSLTMEFSERARRIADFCAYTLHHYLM